MNFKFEPSAEFVSEVERALTAIAGERGDIVTLKKQFAANMYFERKTVFDPQLAAYNAARKIYPYDVTTKVAAYIAVKWPTDPIVAAEVIALDEGYASSDAIVTKAQFFDFVCRCIEDVGKGRMAKDKRQTIVELATLLCQVQGWKVGAYPHEK
ncbi:MAG: hypothetical protein WAW35_15830 [Sideroxyarcus sp.]